jgi:hypothetical protein
MRAFDAIDIASHTIVPEHLGGRLAQICRSQA